MSDFEYRTKKKKGDDPEIDPASQHNIRLALEKLKGTHVVMHQGRFGGWAAHVGGRPTGFFSLRTK